MVVVVAVVVHSVRKRARVGDRRRRQSVVVVVLGGGREVIEAKTNIGRKNGLVWCSPGKRPKVFFALRRAAQLFKTLNF